MDIRCSSCGTEYEFDEQQIPPGGIRVKCEVCQNIFQVTLDGAQDESNEEKEFIIRTRSGDTYNFTELDDLHNLIMEGKVLSTDEISSNGQSWAKLSQLPELEEIFHKKHISDLSEINQDQKSSNDDLQMDSEEKTHRLNKKYSEDELKEPDQTGNLEIENSVESANSEPDFDSELLPSDLNNIYDEHFEAYNNSSRKWPWILGVFILILGASLGGLFYLEVITNPFAKKNNTETEYRSPKIEEDANIVKNVDKLLKKYNKNSYTQAIKLLSGCKSIKCSSYLAITKAFNAYNLFIELQAHTGFRIKASNLKSYPNFLQHRKALIASLKKSALESNTFATEALAKDKNNPIAKAASVISRILLNVPLEKSEVQNMFSHNTSNFFIIFSKGFYEIYSGELEKALQTLKRLKSVLKGDDYNVISSFLFAYSAIQNKDRSLAVKYLSAVCTNHPSVVFTCEFTKRMAKESAPKVDIKKPTKKVSDKVHVTSMKDVSSKETGDYDTFYMKAQQAYKLGQKTKAKNYYLKASHKDPTSADPLNGAAWCYLDMGNATKAAVYFRKALALVPYFGRARYGLAEALRRSGNKKAALKQYKKYNSRHSSGRHISRVRMQIKKLEKELGINVPAAPAMEEKPPVMDKKPVTMAPIIIIPMKPETAPVTPMKKKDAPKIIIKPKSHTTEKDSKK